MYERNRSTEWKSVLIKFRPEMWAAVDEVARQQDMARTNVVRLAVEHYLMNKQQGRGEDERGNGTAEAQ